jgi:hypothetical protein
MPPGEQEDAGVDVRHHFTYRKATGADLCQGDVLQKTPELLVILRKAHRHYANKTYTHFIVLTQTCDLVRRKQTCKARYITLAAVRPLALVLEREVATGQGEFERAAGVASNEVKARLRLLTERLLNNNEPEYFYLHEDAGLGFPESSCAFLRLSIGLRAYQHYDTLVAARIMSLTEGFQAKLGWMVGNLYSRVGTEDWVPGAYAKPKEFRSHIDLLLDSVCTWIDPEQLTEAKRTSTHDPARITAARRRALLTHIKRTQVLGSRERAIQSVLRVLRGVGVDSEEKLRAVERSLLSDPEFKASIPRKRRGGDDDGA